MNRGTTPTLVFDMPFDVSAFPKVWVTFGQQGREIFTIEKSACRITETSIETTLTQDQTLKLKCGCNVEIQIRVLSSENVAMASNILKTSVDRILKDGVI